MADMKILMVCLGNICRSPLAEGIVRELAKQRSLHLEVASAGTGNWHTGQAPDHRSIAAAFAHGYDISMQRAQQFHPKMFEDYDLILVMDNNNLKDVRSLATGPEHLQKVRLFLGEDQVQDPYYDDQLFEPVLLQIEARAEQLLFELEMQS